MLRDDNPDAWRGGRTLPGRQQVNSIQVMRGFAALVVLFYHSGTVYATHTQTLLFGNIFRAGFVGVDVFFVLSGFVIYWLHANDMGKPALLGKFVKKRFARVVPLYWLVVLAKALKEGGATSSMTLLFAFLLIPYPLPPYINVSWTLTFEMVFYMAFGALIFLPKGSLTLLPVAFILFLGLAPAPFTDPVDPGRVIINFFFGHHVLEFVMGATACALAHKLSATSGRLLLLIGMLALCIFFASASYLAFEPNFTQAGDAAYRMSEIVSNQILDYKLVLLGLPASMVLAGAFAWEREGGTSQLLGAAWLGDVSYSLYLSHAFLVHFALSWRPFLLVAKEHQGVMLPLMVLCLVAAWFIHLGVEKPLIGVTRRLLQI